MVHTCFGEYCPVTGSWDCPNRSDREEADKRTAEEIEKAREPIRKRINAANEELYKELSEKLEFVKWLKR
jgi:hypothetical protein